MRQASTASPSMKNGPLDPKLPYRESKILTERLIREQRGNVPIVQPGFMTISAIRLFLRIRSLEFMNAGYSATSP